MAQLLEFEYKAKKGPHELVKGTIKVASESEVLDALGRLGLTPIQIQLQSGKKVQPPKPVTRRAAAGRLKKGELTLFIRNFSNLIKGNVPILKSLTLLANQSKGALGSTITFLQDSVKDGLALSQAMERLSGTFPPLWVAMVRGGESAGVLGEMLERLADHEEKAEDMRRKVRGALVYPLVLLCIGFLTVFVLLTYFMPRLVGVYETNKQALPLPTEIVMGLSGFLSAHWYWLVGAFVLTAALLKRMGGGSKKALWDSLSLKLVFFRGLILKSSLLHFTRTLSLLLSQGVPLVKAISLACATIDNQVLRKQFSGIDERLSQKGESLSTALKTVPLCPPMLTDLIAVGEESGSLSASLMHIANTYERDIEGMLKSFATLLEPLLILVIGSIIGFIVFAMLMPVFQMDVFLD